MGTAAAAALGGVARVWPGLVAAWDAVLTAGCSAGCAVDAAARLRILLARSASSGGALEAAREASDR